MTRQHRYTDEKGVVLYRTVQGDGPKHIVKPDNGEGDIPTSLTGVSRLVPYYLQGLLKSDKKAPVFYTEEEDTCVRLIKMGLSATTHALRHDGWTPELTEFFKGRKVVLLPENDSSSFKLFMAISKDLVEAGVDVKIVYLPDVPKDSGVDYWLGAGGSKDKLLALAEKEKAKILKDTQDGFYPVTVCLDDVETKDVEFLWPGRIPLGSITIISGHPGLGKSSLTLKIISHVTSGKMFPDNTQPVTGSALILSGEDDLAHVIKPRALAVGIDCKKLFTMKTIDIWENGEAKEKDVFINLDHHCEAIGRAIRPDTKIVVIDPLSTYIGKVDSHRDTEVRQVLTKLATLAEEKEVAIVCIMHLNKNRGNLAASRITGAGAFNAAARAVWYVIEDPDVEDRRKWLPGKMNLCKQPDGLAFSTVGVPKSEGQPATVKVVFEDEPLFETADAALSKSEEIERKAPEKDKAVLWLQDVLDAGPKDAKEIHELAEINDFSDRTLFRAKKLIGVVSELSGIGKERCSMWRLP